MCSTIMRKQTRRDTCAHICIQMCLQFLISANLTLPILNSAVGKHSSKIQSVPQTELTYKDVAFSYFETLQLII
jgi:hypothetical protein